MRRLRSTGADGERGDRADARQRFAAEPEGGQAVEVLERGKLRRRVPADRQGQIRGGDAAAVVDDLDQLDSATLNRDPDPGGTGIDGVFDQLLDDRNRAFDDLSGGDLADRSFIEQAKGHAASTPWTCNLHVQSGAVRGLS